VDLIFDVPLDYNEGCREPFQINFKEDPFSVVATRTGQQNPTWTFGIHKIKSRTGSISRKGSLSMDLGSPVDTRSEQISIRQKLRARMIDSRYRAARLETTGSPEPVETTVEFVLDLPMDEDASSFTISREPYSLEINPPETTAVLNIQNDPVISKTVGLDIAPFDRRKPYALCSFKVVPSPDSDGPPQIQSPDQLSCKTFDHPGRRVAMLSFTVQRGHAIGHSYGHDDYQINLVGSTGSYKPKRSLGYILTFEFTDKSNGKTSQFEVRMTIAARDDEMIPERLVPSELSVQVPVFEYKSTKYVPSRVYPAVPSPDDPLPIPSAPPVFSADGDEALRVFSASELLHVGYGDALIPSPALSISLGYFVHDSMLFLSAMGVYGNIFPSDVDDDHVLSKDDKDEHAVMYIGKTLIDKFLNTPVVSHGFSQFTDDLQIPDRYQEFQTALRTANEAETSLPGSEESFNPFDRMGLTNPERVVVMNPPSDFINDNTMTTRRWELVGCAHCAFSADGPIPAYTPEDVRSRSYTCVANAADAGDKHSVSDCWTKNMFRTMAHKVFSEMASQSFYKSSFDVSSEGGGSSSP